MPKLEYGGCFDNELKRRNRLKASLTQQEFMSSLEVRRPAASEAVQMLLDWAATAGLDVGWNPVSFKILTSSAPKPFLYCDTTGSFNVHFAALAQAPAFSAADNREELRSRMNSIGEPIPIENIDRSFQGFYLDRLNPKQLSELVSVLDWIIGVLEG